ncbi:MAG: hypothetical protein GXP08_09560 [Gammaproteobacteria bacterium]|nr:hypothetical protein [Gammaproteobacteria bacterium]
MQRRRQHYRSLPHYHYSQKITDLIKKSPRLRRVVYLSAYSPELNLIKRLWLFFKKNVLYTRGV